MSTKETKLQAVAERWRLINELGSELVDVKNASGRGHTVAKLEIFETAFLRLLVDGMVKYIFRGGDRGYKAMLINGDVIGSITMKNLKSDQQTINTYNKNRSRNTKITYKNH